MIIDTHAHAVSADHARYPLTPTGPNRTSDWVYTRPATCEQIIEQMDAAGIDRVVLVHSTSAYGFENGYEADCAAKYPGRFVAVGGIDAGAPDAAERIAYWVRQRGIVGLRIYAAGPGVANEEASFVDDPASFPAWNAITDLGIPMLLHVRFHALPRVETLLKRFPKVPIVLDNLTTPNLDDGPPYAASAALFDLARYPQLYVKATSILMQRDLSGGRGDFPSFFDRVVKTFGAERMVWGSNFPGSPGTLSDHLALARRVFSGLSGADQKQIFGETALRLYPDLART